MWCGTDFNPSQARFAQSLIRESGADANLYDEAFSEFCTRRDLPEFDSIGLHGIWSWINDENRKVIVEFVRRKLKVGGVLYVSYNTHPGWAAMVPMRDLLTEHAEVMGTKGAGIIKRIDAALEFAERLIETHPAYARANPLVPERLKKIKEQNRNYLAHEYFNRDWLPMSFSKMGEWLLPAKLDWACSANYLDHIDALNLSSDQQALLKEIPDPLFRQTVRDFMVNQQFRKDYWVKGARKLNSTDQIEAIRLQRVILVQPRSDVSLKVSGGLGEAKMNEAVYGPILDVLADHQSKTLGEIERLMEGRVSIAQVLQAAMVLTGSGSLMAVQDDDVAAKARQSCDKLNAHLLDKARGGAELNCLASPVTGGGITVSRFQQLFLLALLKGKSNPAEWAAYAWQILASQGQRLVKNNKPIETAEENLAELTLQACSFAEKQLPIMKALQVA